MLSKRDCIYYDWLFDKIKPKNLWWLSYCKTRKFITVCKTRKFITVRESPSKVEIWSWSKFGRFIDKALKEKR